MRQTTGSLEKKNVMFLTTVCCFCFVFFPTISFSSTWPKWLKCPKIYFVWFFSCLAFQKLSFFPVFAIVVSRIYGKDKRGDSLVNETLVRMNLCAVSRCSIWSNWVRNLPTALYPASIPWSPLNPWRGEVGGKKQHGMSLWTLVIYCIGYYWHM